MWSCYTRSVSEKPQPQPSQICETYEIQQAQSQTMGKKLCTSSQNWDENMRGCIMKYHENTFYDILYDSFWTQK